MINLLKTESSTYKRFKKLSDQFNEKWFQTKLGSRLVCCRKWKKEDKIDFIYYDNQSTKPNALFNFCQPVLFFLIIDKYDGIVYKNSKIDELALFCAVYELEQILNKENKKVTKPFKLDFLFKWHS